MHILRGKTALSEFRLNKLLFALKQKVPDIQTLECQFIHFIHSRTQLDSHEINQMNTILVTSEQENTAQSNKKKQ